MKSPKKKKLCCYFTPKEKENKKKMSISVVRVDVNKVHSGCCLTGSIEKPYTQIVLLYVGRERAFEASGNRKTKVEKKRRGPIRLGGLKLPTWLMLVGQCSGSFLSSGTPKEGGELGSTHIFNLSLSLLAPSTQSYFLINRGGAPSSILSPLPLFGGWFALTRVLHNHWAKHTRTPP